MSTITYEAENAEQAETVSPFLMLFLEYAQQIGAFRVLEKLVKVNVGPKDTPEVQVSAAEFVLEGLHAHKRIGRNEERVFTAGEKQPKHTEKPFEREDVPSRGRRPYN